MAGSRARRVALVLATALVLLALAGAAGLHFATQALKSKIEAALGPASEVGAIRVGFSAIEIESLRVKAIPGWPAEDQLRARRIVVVPELADLLSARVRLSRITVEDAYLAVLRTREGRLRILPSLLEREKAGDKGEAGVPVAIATVELKGGVLELFDATVRTPPHKVRLEELQARIEGIRLPELTGKTQLAIDGKVRGVQRNGSLALKGWLEIASRNSELSLNLKSVDMLALQPYLIKAAETGVKKGSLDLVLKSAVKDNRLHAPGTLTLAGLELANSGNTFMGVPRQAVVGALKGRDGVIAVSFTLEGNLSDPRFSLNENLAMRLGSSVAQTLGISVEGLARGVGDAASGVGGAMRKLFGK